MPLNQCFCRAALPPTPSTPGKEEEEKILEVWGYGPVFVYIAPSTGTRKGRGMDLYIRICSHYPLHTGTRKGGGVGLYLFTLPPPHRYKEGWGCGPVFVHITPSTPVQGRVGVWACICSHCPLNTVQGRVWVWACICSHCPLHTGTRKGGGIGLYLFTLPPPYRYKEGWGYRPVFVHTALSTPE